MSINIKPLNRALAEIIGAAPASSIHLLEATVVAYKDVESDPSTDTVKGLIKTLDELDFAVGQNLGETAYKALQGAIYFCARYLARESRKRREVEQLHHDYSLGARAHFVEKRV